MSRIALFFICFLLGGVLRVLYFLQSLLAKKTALKGVTFTLDFLWCAVAGTSFFLISLLLAGGGFYFYMLCATLAGFFLVSIWL